MIDKNRPRSERRFCQTEDGRTRSECRFEDESSWLTQEQIAERFETAPQNITTHLKAVVEKGELAEKATCKQYLHVRREGARDVAHWLPHHRIEPRRIVVAFVQMTKALWKARPAKNRRKR